MLSQHDAHHFADQWIAAWSSHDLERILAHYSEDIEFTSPFIVKILNDASGTLRGREKLRAYFGRALAAYPELHFELHRVCTSVASVVLEYTSVNGLHAAEVMMLTEGGKVGRVWAHYGS
jgi:ketosteroid isomerase-like protein